MDRGVTLVYAAAGSNKRKQIVPTVPSNGTFIARSLSRGKATGFPELNFNYKMNLMLAENNNC